MPNTPAVAVLNPTVKFGLAKGHLLRNEPLDRCMWPLGQPDHLRGGRVGDLGPDDHVVAMLQNLPSLGTGLGVAANISVVLAEPAAIHGPRYPGLIRKAKRFHRILSYNDDVLRQVPNGQFFPFGSTWVGDWRERDLNKTKMCSLIASSKRSYEGHRLRHAIATWAQDERLDVDLLGHAYAPFKAKADGLATYRYSVVIENVQEPNYFSEKLIDALLCKTVPVYWGCPNIADFMDTSGMIVCQSEDDLRAAVVAISESDYEARPPGLMAVEDRAAHYGDFFGRMARAVLEHS